MTCQKCNQTGLIPFIKAGKVVSHAFLDCECKLSTPEHFDPIQPRPEDFDFPMSSTYRAFSFQYCGVPDPGADNEKVPEPDTIPLPPWQDKQWESVKQLRGMVLFLQNKLNLISDKRKKQYKNYTIK